MNDFGDEDGGDEDLEDEEENEADQAHKNKLKEVVDTIRLGRSMNNQRPSTIVQVNTGALEIHLRQMKKQLQRHEEELKHPSWMDDLMKEVNKIAILERKLEHCQLDINNLRDVLSSQNMKPLSETEITEKIKQLISDVEGVRLIIRRIDVQNALQSNALNKITELQKAVKGILKDQKGGANSTHLLRLQDTLEGHINTLRNKVEEMDVSATTLRARVVESESHLLNKLDALDKSHTQRLTTLEQKTMNDIGVAVEKMKGTLEKTSITANRAMLLSMKSPLLKASDLLKTAVGNRKVAIQRFYFRKWQEFDPYGVLRRGRDALRLFTHSGQRFILRRAYQDWKKYHKLKLLREKYAERIKNILRIWDRLVNPNRGHAFRKWKRTVVFMKFHGSYSYSRSNSMNLSRAPSMMAPLSPQIHEGLEQEVSQKNIFLQNGSSYSFDFDAPQGANEGKSFLRASSLPEELINTIEQIAPPVLQEDGLYDRLMGSLNIRKDPVGCVDLIGLYIDNILQKIRSMANLMGNTHILINNNSEALERTRLQLLQTMNKKFETIESVHNYHKTGVSGQFARLRQDISERQEFDNEKHGEYKREFAKISDQLSQLDKRLLDQEDKISRLYNLHGKMLDRMDKIDSTQSKHQEEISVLSDIVHRVDKISSNHEANFAERTRRLDDSMVHLNSEIQANKQTQKQVLLKLEEVVKSQVNGTSDVKSIAHDISRRMDKLESWMNTTAPLPPTPLEIATICIEYEDKAMESHARGRGANHLAISTDMAYDMGRIAHILAQHVVEITDIDVLSHVMKGLHLSFSEGNPHQESHESLWHAADNKGDQDSVPLTHEEYCISLREKFLMSYFDQFQFDIEKLRPEVGIVRKEARLTFLRRFIESLELSLSKLDAIVVGTSSSIGRTNTTGGMNTTSSPAPASCIACDRPLRMRITSTPLGKLHHRVAQNQELSPKSKRKQLQTQQHLHATTPSFHSNNHTTSTVGKKKGLMLGGMTFPTSASMITPSKTLGIDHFQNTINEEVSINSNDQDLAVDVTTFELQTNHDPSDTLNHTSPRPIDSSENASPISQSTSVLANELRKLVKMSSSTPQLPPQTNPSSSTALMGYSRSTSKLPSKRPKSAGPAGNIHSGNIKTSQFTYTGPLAQNHSQNSFGGGGGGGDDLTPKYVKKGGFKMRTAKTMPQERLVENLSKNYLQDKTFPSGEGAEIYFPSGDQSSEVALNLSSVSQARSSVILERK